MYHYFVCVCVKQLRSLDNSLLTSMKWKLLFKFWSYIENVLAFYHFNKNKNCLALGSSLCFLT